MRPDDEDATLEALVPKEPPNTPAPVAAVRARRRTRQRRIAFAGIAAALLAVAAAVGSVSAFRNAVNTATTGLRISVPPPARGPHPSSAFPSPLEGWKCGNPLQYTADGGRSWHTVLLARATPTDAGSPCTAVAGGYAWTTSHNTDFSVWHLIRIRYLTDIHAFALPPVDKSDLDPTLTFVDPDKGWFITGPARGDHRVYRTDDGGATWTLATKVGPRGQIVFADTQRGWAKYGGELATTDDGGATWRPVVLPAQPWPGDTAYIRIAATGHTVVVWAGALISGSQYKPFFDVSTDDGATWSVRAGPKGFELPQVNNMFAVSDATHWV